MECWTFPPAYDPEYLPEARARYWFPRRETMPAAEREAAILEGLRRRNVTPVLWLELFERYVQPVIDGYLPGLIPEEEFIKSARPWPRYATDYL